MLKAIFFDLDGTLFFTRKANFLAYQKAFLTFGVNLTEEEYKKCFGLNITDLISNLAPYLMDKISEIKKEKNQHYVSMLDLVSPNKGLLKFLEEIKKNYRVGIVSTASRYNGIALLKHYKIDDWFDFMIFSEDLNKFKPDPECYLKAMELMQVKADECLAFEDSPFGIEAATRAGINVIKVEEIE